MHSFKIRKKVPLLFFAACNSHWSITCIDNKFVFTHTWLNQFYLKMKKLHVYALWLSFRKWTWVSAFNILIENFIANWSPITHNRESFCRPFDNRNEYGHNLNKSREGCKRFSKTIALNSHGTRGKNTPTNNSYSTVLGWLYRNSLSNKWFLFRLKPIYV